MSERNPFWLRTEKPDPERYYKRARIEAERMRKLKSALPTIFDVEAYFVKSGRGDMVDNVGNLKQQKIEDALMHDLEKAKTQDEKNHIRRLLQVAATGGYPKPEMQKAEVIKLINERIGKLHREYLSRLESGDDTEIEEYLMSNWRRLAYLISSRNKNVDDFELSFIEGALSEARKNLSYNPKSNLARETYEKLKRIRTAMYFEAEENLN